MKSFEIILSDFTDVVVVHVEIMHLGKAPKRTLVTPRCLNQRNLVVGNVTAKQTKQLTTVSKDNQFVVSCQLTAFGARYSHLGPEYVSDCCLSVLCKNRYGSLKLNRKHTEVTTSNFHYGNLQALYCRAQFAEIAGKALQACTVKPQEL